VESISKLVSDSLARHGMEPSLDHLRLEWSPWFRCESSFSVLLVPAKPGIFALGEEMVLGSSSGELTGALPVDRKRSEDPDAAVKRGTLAPEVSSPARKRMLALFQISEADDLGMALGRLFLPGNPFLGKLNSGRCFARYAVIEDATQRLAAYAVFQRWMRDSADTASGIQEQPCGPDIPVRADQQQPLSADTPVRPAETENKSIPDSDVHTAVPPSISSAWGAGFLEVQNQEADRPVRRPAPLPSGL
jgi:hypothetical protein